MRAFEVFNTLEMRLENKWQTGKYFYYVKLKRSILVFCYKFLPKHPKGLEMYLSCRDASGFVPGNMDAN